MGVDRRAFEYSVFRVVPRVDRGESMNVGVLLYCKGFDFLEARVQLDRVRLAALDAHANADDVESALRAALDCSLRHAEDNHGRLFHWLTAPRSTVVQPGPVHTGLTLDPAADLQRLFEALVLPI